MLSDARQTLPRLFSVCAIVLLVWTHSGIAAQREVRVFCPGCRQAILRPGQLAYQSYQTVPALRWGIFGRRLVPCAMYVPGPVYVPWIPPQQTQQQCPQQPEPPAQPSP